MGVAYNGGRRFALCLAALVFTSSSSLALAQTAVTTAPLPPSPGSATVVEKPDSVPPQPQETPPAEPVTPAPTAPSAPAPEQGPAHVPKDASGFHLSTLETKDLTLLYIDPIQTYLTPYIARAFENSIAFHEKNLHW